jgi:ubiquinone/menaquinone biosynthesis C-methylase UbiE
MERDKIKDYYNNEIESNRLNLDYFKLEGIRTKEIITRFLISNNFNIIDIGGGAGFYSFWLQSLGHRVSLVDLSPKNIELANDYAAKNSIGLESCSIGDATQLKFPDNNFDIALLLGPLYHLTNREERVTALREAKRVLKPGGIMIAAFISRYASLLDGFRRDLIKDDRFEKILLGDLKDGIHINETDNPEYFTTAYFHTPRAIEDEIMEGGMKLEKIVAVESVGWVIDDFSDKIKDLKYWSRVQNILNEIESNPDLIAMSPHILSIARK